MLQLFPLAVVVAANVLGAAMAIPQARTLYRTRNTSGVSPTWAAMSIAINAWWGAYAIGIRDLAILPVSIVSVTAYSAIAIALLRFNPSRSTTLRGLGLGALVAVIPLPVAVSGNWQITGVLLGALYALQLSPAVVAVYRSADVTGVSMGTWLMAWVEAVLWAVYSVPARDAGLLALAATGLAMSSLVLVRLFVKRPRRSRSDQYAFAS